SLDIGRSATDIFAYLADLHHLAEWEQTTASIESITDSVGEAGVQRYTAQCDFTLRWDKLPFAKQSGADSANLTVIRREPATLLVWTTDTGDARWSRETEMVLEPVRPTITTVRMRIQLKATN